MAADVEGDEEAAGGVSCVLAVLAPAAASSSSPVSMSLRQPTTTTPALALATHEEHWSRHPIGRRAVDISDSEAVVPCAIVVVRVVVGVLSSSLLSTISYHCSCCSIRQLRVVAAGAGATCQVPRGGITPATWLWRFWRRGYADSNTLGIHAYPAPSELLSSDPPITQIQLYAITLPLRRPLRDLRAVHARRGESAGASYYTAHGGSHTGLLTLGGAASARAINPARRLRYHAPYASTLPLYPRAELL